MTLLSDTQPEAEAVLLRLLRETPVWRKMQLLGQLNQMTRSVALSGLRQQYPQASETQLQRLLADRLLGPDLAAQAYGPLPAFIIMTQD